MGLRQPLRRLRRHLPINGEERELWDGGQPLRRLRRHLPINGEERELWDCVSPSGAFGATSP